MNNDEIYKERCRSMVFNGNEFLITEVGTSMEEKAKLGVNCDGFGRKRIFKRNKYSDWVDNPLPFAPYSIVMGEKSVDELAVQVFQIAKCNLNCWWCFLPDDYKNCNINHTKWFTVEDLLELFIRDTKGTVKVIDISGGNPELVPEFTLRFMSGLEKYGLAEKIYLWSDDVLTTDFLFTKLSEAQVQYMSKYQRYGKVACFKGIDDESFCYNTCVTVSEHQKQLTMAKKYIDLGFDIYFYVILTMPNMKNINNKISTFIDKLQGIAYYLPLRVVPIKIMKFANNMHRFNAMREVSIFNQFEVLALWKEEIAKRYTSCEIESDISSLPLK